MAIENTCETCGHFCETNPGVGRCYRYAPRSGVEASWPDVGAHMGCGEHTALARRRERIALAGQLAFLIGERETENNLRRRAKRVIQAADTILERIDCD